MIGFGLIGLQFTACVNQPIQPMPVDTMTVDTMPVDTTPTDTTSVDTLRICDPDSIHFQQDVLPILITNCASNGCHSATSASDGVILDSYENVLATTDIKTANPAASNLYEVLVDTDPGDIMPPSGALPNSQIEVIFKWLEQGALNLDCEKDSAQCDTIAISYAAQVVPILTTHHCIACHRVGNAVGGIKLDSYPEAKKYADNGQLYGSIAHLMGFEPMPRDEPKLSNCEIRQVKAWIDDGAREN